MTKIRGAIVTPSDPRYDDARRVFYGSVDKHPAMIIRAADAADVQHVVNSARDGGHQLAVRSGGHSPAGHSSTDGGIVLDLRDLSEIDIDLKQRTAWVGAGSTALAFTEAVQKQGLVVGFGDSGSVGVGGITLGGGVGFLVRKYGLTIDSLLAADVVTADGQLVRASADEHPDLFWAIRGGGGNFGVVTRLQFRLHDIQPFTGGMLLLPATADTIAGFVAASLAAPEELSSIANVMPAPPMPFIPKEVHGTLVIMALMAYVGDDAAAQRAIAPFRALASPLADMVKPMPYVGMYPPEDPNMHPSAVARTMFLDAFDRATAETIVDFLSRSDAPMRATQLRVLGGAVTRVPSDATAFAFRDRAMIVNLASFYDSPETRVKREAWVTQFAEALQPNDASCYVNFLGNEGEARIRAAYPGATWDRLTRIKATYDPENLFHLNQNIPPASE
ncbi:MAG: FAD-binding oxidoreductase [bacterium]